MIVCICNAITEQEVRSCARAGAQNPEAPDAKRGCEPQCGTCLCYAQEIIDEELKSAPRLRLVDSIAA